MVATKKDVEYLLRHLNEYLARPVTPNEIVSGFAGARPLVGSEDQGDTKKLARDDVIEVDRASGLISIMGGKWITHRAMAEDTINTVQNVLDTPLTESRTRNYVLYGGVGYTDDYWLRLCREHHVSEETAQHLARKFGSTAEDVLSLRNKDNSLADLILEGRSPIRAEVVYSVRYEMAATIEDVLARRLGMQLFSWRDAIDAAPVIGSLMAEELNWTNAFTKAAIARYVESIEHLLDTAGLSFERSALTIGVERTAR